MNNKRIDKFYEFKNKLNELKSSTYRSFADKISDSKLKKSAEKMANNTDMYGDPNHKPEPVLIKFNGFLVDNRVTKFTSIGKAFVGEDEYSHNKYPCEEYDKYHYSRLVNCEVKSFYIDNEDILSLNVTMYFYPENSSNKKELCETLIKCNIYLDGESTSLNLIAFMPEVDDDYFYPFTVSDKSNFSKLEEMFKNAIILDMKLSDTLLEYGISVYDIEDYTTIVLNKYFILCQHEDENCESQYYGDSIINNKGFMDKDKYKSLENFNIEMIDTDLQQQEYGILRKLNLKPFDLHVNRSNTFVIFNNLSSLNDDDDDLLVLVISDGLINKIHFEKSHNGSGLKFKNRKDASSFLSFLNDTLKGLFNEKVNYIGGVRNFITTNKKEVVLSRGSKIEVIGGELKGVKGTFISHCKENGYEVTDIDEYSLISYNFFGEVKSVVVLNEYIK